MRTLNSKQKKLLTKWIQEHQHLKGLGVFDLKNYDEFTPEFFQEMIKLNDFETIYDHINDFIQEESWKILDKKKVFMGIYQ